MTWQITDHTGMRLTGGFDTKKDAEEFLSGLKKFSKVEEDEF